MSIKDQPLTRDKSGTPVNEPTARHALLHESSRSGGLPATQDRAAKLPEGMATADQLMPEKAKPAEKLNLDAPRFKPKATNPNGTMYANEEGIQGYFRSNCYQNGAALSFSETHFGKKPEENYHAIVNQFHSGLITYEYDNGSKIAMRKDHSGWSETPEQQGSKQIITFDTDHYVTDRINIHTDSSGNVTQGFSNGAVRKLNADGSKYEKAVAPDGSGEERNYNSQGQLIATKQFSSPTRSDSEKPNRAKPDQVAAQTALSPGLKSVPPEQTDNSPSSQTPAPKAEKQPPPAREIKPETGRNLNPEGKKKPGAKTADPSKSKSKTEAAAESSNDFPQTAKAELEERLTFDINDQVALERYMKENYNATFSGDNERYDVYGNSLISRRPTLPEVQVAFTSILRFGLIDKKEGIKFVYAAQPIIGPGNVISGLNNANAIYQKQAMFFPPNYNIEKLTNQPYHWFEKDTVGPYRARNMPVLDNVCVEDFILHELAHSIDERRDPKAWEKDHRNTDLSRQYGFMDHIVWTKLADGRIAGITRSAIEGKQDDYFVFDENGRWERYHFDPFGGGFDGYVTFDQMAALAKVPPGTIVWTAPFEASADIKAAIYGKKISRESVLAKSPPAYRSAVMATQEDIDFSRPGEGLMRSADGRLVKKSRAALNELDPIARQVLLDMTKAKR